MRAIGRSPWLCTLLPVAGALGFRALWGDGAWHAEPLHSTIEAAGALIALLVAALLLLRKLTFAREPHFAWVAAALTCMGLLDLAHACVAPGPAFFWSRALPTIAGGWLMALVWVDPRAAGPRFAGTCVAVTAALTAPVCVALLAFPDAWPLMFSAAGYSVVAKLLNVLGGVGFAAAAAFFLRRRRRGGSREDLVLADHCLLFATAGLLFSMSHLWGAVWWLFHVLRLAAYAVVLGYVFDLYRRFQSHQGALEARLEFQQLMLGTVGHDLRGPITAMRVTIDGLRRRQGGSPEAQRQAIERIDRSARRLEELVATLLDFARARAGHGIPVERRPVDLQEVVARAIDEVVAANPGRRIELAVRGDASGRYDAPRVAQLAANLLQNAVRYGPAEGAIDVALDGAEHHVTLAVHNGGDPIPSAVLPRLFEPFQRGRAGGEKGSLGLGLFIVREIARAHGGDVAVTSTGERGTTVRVTLPRGDVTPSDAPPAAVRQSAR